MPKFNIGDKVRLVNPTLPYNGQEGIVIGPVPSKQLTYKITKQGGSLEEAYDRANAVGVFTQANESDLVLVKPAYLLESEQVLQEPAICDSSNAVNHPAHYNQGKFEVIDVIDDWGLGFKDGNAVKYIARAKHKGKRKEDLQKAVNYLQMEIDSIDD